MRDVVSHSTTIAGPRVQPLGWIRLAGRRLRDWIEGRAARAAEAALYHELSKLSDAELDRRGIPRGDLHRCVDGSSDGPADADLNSAYALLATPRGSLLPRLDRRPGARKQQAGLVAALLAVIILMVAMNFS